MRRPRDKTPRILATPWTLPYLRHRSTDSIDQTRTPMNSIVFRILPLIALAGCLAVTGCSSTKFTSTWKMPGARLTHIQPGARVGVMIIHPEKSVERAAEDALAAELERRGLEPVRAYAVLGETDARDESAAQAAFAQTGAEAMVVMRGMGERTEVNYRPPSYYSVPSYSGFWGGYYGYGWQTVYDPGYLSTYQVVTVETLVYDLKSNQLVWGGQSRTTDPNKLGIFIREIVDEAVRAMKKDGVL